MRLLKAGIGEWSREKSTHLMDTLSKNMLSKLGGLYGGTPPQGALVGLDGNALKTRR
jgi:hypothetical protein